MKEKEKLSSVCDELFYNDNNLKGSVGIKNLGKALSMTDEEFENYMKDF